jgi:enoyl-CoA hydratase/carnithine racemase
MSYDYNTLACSIADGILEIELNRPEKRNAITHEMQREIDEALDEAELDGDVKSVLFTGRGAVFTAGHDLNEQSSGKSFPDLTFPHAVPSVHPHFPRAWYFRKPMIAGIHGFVGAYGLALAGCSDFNIAATGTRFSTEIFRLGSSSPDIGWLPLYVQLPMRVIEKLWLLGGWMDAEQALQFQLVQRVVAPEDVRAEARRWAEQAALIPTDRFGHNKDQIRRSFELMGLANLPAALNRFGPPIDLAGGGGSEFGQNVLELGLKEALRIRDAKFDPDVSRV